MAAEKLRDLTQPIDVDVLDDTIANSLTGEIAAAGLILQDLQANPNTWRQVGHILRNTESAATMVFALQVLEEVVKYRWNALSESEQQELKDYICDCIVQFSRNKSRLDVHVNMLSHILVQILMHDWPEKWTRFIPNLIELAYTGETVVREYCMSILKVLIEEVFDFSRGEMTLQRSDELDQSLIRNIEPIHKFCLNVLLAPPGEELVRSRLSVVEKNLIRLTLSAVHAYLSWIPPSYIFESDLLETLLKFLKVGEFRSLAVQCLTEIAAIDVHDVYDVHLLSMYSMFVGHLKFIFTRLAPYSDQEFNLRLAVFLTTFFKIRIKVLEPKPVFLLMGFEHLLNLSYSNEIEVFKVCIEYWDFLVRQLAIGKDYHIEPRCEIFQLFQSTSEWCAIYLKYTSKLTELMINRMANPEEVHIFEDENGNKVRETMKGNDVLVQYKIMQDTLINLLYLDFDDTVNQMLAKLSMHVNGKESELNTLNSLCWAIGSISGSMTTDQEDSFLQTVFHDLCQLFEKSKSSSEINKAVVVAISMMYVFGQYPRFLSADWKNLKAVVEDLFLYMHVTHPGVQDMACDTFFKIVQNCKREFVIVQDGEKETFVSELLSRLATTVQDLEPHQIHSFYESVGNMIQAETDPQKRDEYLKRLMELPNQKWAEIIAQATQSQESRSDPDVILTVIHILQTNTSAATSLGTCFLSQISLIIGDMLDVYRKYSELLSDSITDDSKKPLVKLSRSVKRETINLIETFLDKADVQPRIRKEFVRPMMKSVLSDYERDVAGARESEVLSLLATIINKYKATMLDDVPCILQAVFDCTWEMITQSLDDYPEHRLNFFSLLLAIATFCFPALTELRKEVMNSIFWAIKHIERNIAETGLNLLLAMLKNFQQSESCNQFFRLYFTEIEEEIFDVLTDTLHKPGFELHVLVLQQLFCLVDSGSLTENLGDAETVPYDDLCLSNASFVLEYTINLLSSSIPTMTSREAREFVNRLYGSRNELSGFKDNIRDLLVQFKKLSAQDNKNLYPKDAAALREKERQKMILNTGLMEWE